jgi:AraC-like DNA-binding protein
MHFQRFAPCEQLQPYVQYFWSLQSPSQDHPAPAFRTIADGCPGLVFQQPTSGPVLGPAGKPWPTLLLHGQTTQPGYMQPLGALGLVGACLHPSAVPAFFRLSAAELTDACVDLESLPAPNRFLLRQLQDAPTTEQQVHWLSAQLLAALPPTRGPADPVIAYAVEKIRAAPHQVSLAQLRAEGCLSERSFQRRFKHAVGVTPQLFARICRFQASLHQLRMVDYERLSDLAYAHAYADQSHHIRAFQEFAGVSPRQYCQQARPELAGFAALL